MSKKYLFLLILIPILMISLFFPVQGEDIDESFIKELINKGEVNKALNILQEEDISDNPDLQFYEALLLSWEGDYEKAEEKLLILVEKYPTRFDFYDHLARLYNWMGKAFKSVEYSKKAYDIAKGTSYEKDYLKRLELAEDKIKAKKFVNLEIVQDNKLSTNILGGQKRPINDNLDFSTALGLNYWNADSNFLLRTKLNFIPENFKNRLRLSTSFNLTAGGERKNINFYNNLSYLLNEKNSLALNLNVFESKNFNDYQNLELEYKHKWDKSTIILKSISRNDKSGLTLDFSQNINVYYRLDRYLLNMNISHYKGGEYVFKTGIELSNLDFLSDWKISRLNSWFDNKNNGKLSLEIEEE
ncbi:MAG: tetratricopeptide repeat protein [Bacillota bacterium]